MDRLALAAYILFALSILLVAYLVMEPYVCSLSPPVGSSLSNRSERFTQHFLAFRCSERFVQMPIIGTLFLC